MLFFRQLAVFAALACVLACSVQPALSHGAETRPNGLDRRVNSIAAAQLERLPAAELLDPDRQIAAARLARWMIPGWLLSILFQIVVLAYFWQSGAAAKLRDRFRRVTRNETAVRFLFGASLALIARLAALLPGFYIFRVGRVMGLSDTLLRAWALTWVANTILAMLIAGVVVAIVLLLVDRTHQWYIYTMFAIVAGSFAITFFAPNLTFDRIRPVPAGLRAPIAALETRAGIAVPVVVDERNASTHDASATVQGLGPTVRIVVAEALLAGQTPGELRFVIAHELGEIAAYDPIRSASVNALLVIFGVALAVSIADRIGFRRDDDPISRLALVAALLGCVYFIAAPIDNAVLRSMSRNADEYAVVLSGNRADAVRSVIRAADQQLDEVCPNVMTRLFLETTPAVGDRVAAFNNVPKACP